MQAKPLANITLFFSFLLPIPVQAEWGDWLELLKEPVASGTATTSLSRSEVISGLKQALNKGSEAAIKQLGTEDGFFKDPQLKIPMPEQLQKVESVLRSMKQDEMADDFVLSMNRAAEQAVPAAKNILLSIVQNMSVEDAYGILQGPDNAATNYLRENGGGQLKQQFLPVVQQATDRVGVTRQYKSMIDSLGMMHRLVDTASLDVDNYVTEKAIDGLFQLIGDEERLIRADPAARTTELLKKVFNHN